MKELLEQLKELDPETYERITNLTMEWGAAPRNQALDHLQGEIQREIDKLDMFWYLERADPKQKTSKYLCYVIDTSTLVYANSPAEAILAAYINALKKVKA